jgi:hypothetical protein
MDGSGGFKSSANYSANFSAPRGRGRGRGGGPRGRGNGGRGQGRGGRPPFNNNNRGALATTTTTAADKDPPTPRSHAKYVANPGTTHGTAGTATARMIKRSTPPMPPPTESTQIGTWTVEPRTTSPVN